jgi:hypothetical protein
VYTCENTNAMGSREKRSRVEKSAERSITRRLGLPQKDGRLCQDAIKLAELPS